MKAAAYVQAALARMLPRAKDRRALAVGGIVISTTVLLGRGIPAWREWDEAARRGVEESWRELALTQSALAVRRSNESERGQLARQLDSLSGAYLHATGTAVAGASLATLVSNLASESGVRVTSASVRPDSATKAAFTRIAVRISATGDVEGLSEYLGSIESSEQLLAVRELSVAQADPAAPDSRPEALRFEILVEGLVRIDPKERATTPSRGQKAPSPSLVKQ